MSKLVILDHPLISHKLSIMRLKETGSMDFRQLLSEITMLLAYEATRDLPTYEMEIETPIGKTTGKFISDQKVGIIPILRAGLGMVDGFLSVLPTARVGHIGLYRDHETMKPVEYYFKIPDDAANRLLIVLDPMLATGGSAVAAINCLKQRGCSNIKMINLIAAPEGVKAVQEAHPDVDIFIAQLDECLNEHAYIVPGLGDAGDRLYGTK